MQRRPYSFELAAERSLTPLHDRRVLDAIQTPEPSALRHGQISRPLAGARHNGFGSTLRAGAILGVAMQNNRILIVAQDLKRCQANDVTFESTGSRRWAWSDARFCPAPDGARGLACLFNSSSRCLEYVNEHRSEIVEVNDYRPTTLNSHHPFVTSRRVCDGAQCGSQYSRPERLAPGPHGSPREHKLTFGRGWHVAAGGVPAQRHDGAAAAAPPRAAHAAAVEEGKVAGGVVAHARDRASAPPARPRGALAPRAVRRLLGRARRRAGQPDLGARAVGRPGGGGDGHRADHRVCAGGEMARGVARAARGRHARAHRHHRGPRRPRRLPTAAPATWRLHVYEYERHATLGEAGGERSIGSTSLLQLFLALEARLFVCTTGSNWCRLINELRKTRLDRSAGCGGNCTLFADLCYGEW